MIHQTNVPEMFRTPEALAGFNTSLDKFAAYLAGADHPPWEEAPAHATGTSWRQCGRAPTAFVRCEPFGAGVSCPYTSPKARRTP